MHKFSLHLVAFSLLALYWIVSSASAAPVANAYPLIEPFDTATDGKINQHWSIVTAGGEASVEPVPSASMRSLKLGRTRADGILAAHYDFNPMHGIATVEVRIMSTDAQGFKGLPSILSADGHCAATVGVDQGKIICLDGAVQREVQPFQPGEWYVIRVVMNLSAATYDLYVDAICKVRGAKFVTPAADITRVVFSIEDGPGKDAYFNDIVAYEQAVYVGKPPAPVFDITRYGALGDGKTNNTAAVQKAIDACAGTNGSVYVPAGIFVSGTVHLKSDMTLFLDPAATLLGSTEDVDYPELVFSAADNVAVGTHKVFLFADMAKNLRIDGGGTIDGSGNIPRWRMNGGEKKRPVLVGPVRCENLTVQNVYLKDSSVWCLVPVECSNVSIRNVNIDSRAYGNRDGIDPVDCKHVLIEHCTIDTDDDSICPKSGIRNGVEDLRVNHCNLAGSGRASGIKFGTVSYGQFKDALFEDIMIKNCDKAAIGLEAVDGADIANITFRRMVITNTNSPFYLVIGTRGRTPRNDVKKIGSINHILYEDITARDLKHNLGCPISGNIVDEKRYPVTNLVFRRCDLTFKGGVDWLPAMPPEMGTQYPECTNWGELPTYGYFIRHADHVSFIDCKATVSPPDVRPANIFEDVTGLNH